MSSQYGSVPQPGDQLSSHGYGPQSNTTDFAHNNPTDPSPLSQSYTPSQQGQFDEDGSVLDDSQAMNRSASSASTAVPATAPSRSGTLKKRTSVSRKTSLKRSGSRKSLRSGGIKGVGRQPAEFNSALYTPIPTQGSPTEILANRFQGK